MVRITWFSNAPWGATGYGTQTAEVTRRLNREVVLAPQDAKVIKRLLGK